MCKEEVGGVNFMKSEGIVFMNDSIGTVSYVDSEGMTLKSVFCKDPLEVLWSAF